MPCLCHMVVQGFLKMVRRSKNSCNIGSALRVCGLGLQDKAHIVAGTYKFRKTKVLPPANPSQLIVCCTRMMVHAPGPRQSAGLYVNPSARPASVVGLQTTYKEPYGSKYPIIIYLPKTYTRITITQIPST